MIIDSKLRIFPTHKSGTAIHFLISDSTGESAIIEFIDGKMISYTGSQMPVRVLANNTYEKSMDLWEKNRDATYYNRFIIAARHLEKYEHQNLDTSAENAFSILDDVSQKRYTKWSIVYDIKNLMVSYRTGSNRGIRHVDLKRIDFFL